MRVAEPRSARLSPHGEAPSRSTRGSCMCVCVCARGCGTSAFILRVVHSSAMVWQSVYTAKRRCPEVATSNSSKTTKPTATEIHCTRPQAEKTHLYSCPHTLGVASGSLLCVEYFDASQGSMCGNGASWFEWIDSVKVRTLSRTAVPTTQRFSKPHIASI